MPIVWWRWRSCLLKICQINQNLIQKRKNKRENNGKKEVKPEWKADYDFALKRIRSLTGLTLTNLEKRELQEKVKVAMEVQKNTQNKRNQFSIGNEAAVWFIKENYGVDCTDQETISMLSDIDYEYGEKGGKEILKDVWFKRKQEEKHKP